MRRTWAHRERLRGDAGREQAGDEGVTLVETLVAMGIFSVVMAIFMAAVVSMTSTTTRVNATADAGDGVRAVFLKMDRQVRYADAINPSVQGTSGDWYVEFRTSQRANGQPTLCTQWRYDRATSSLQYRSWNDGQTPAASWLTVSTRVQTPAQSPFTVKLVDPTSPQVQNQKLLVAVKAASGAGATAGQASIQTTFVARNSSASSPTNTAGTFVCPQATRP